MTKQEKRYMKRIYPENLYPEIRINRLLNESINIQISDNKKESADLPDEIYLMSVAKEVFKIIEHVEFDVRVLNNQLYVGFKNMNAISSFISELMYRITVCGDYGLVFKEYTPTDVHKGISLFISLYLTYFVKYCSDIKSTYLIRSQNDVLKLRSMLNDELYKFTENILSDWSLRRCYVMILPFLSGVVTTPNENNIDEYIEPYLGIYRIRNF